VLNFIAVDNCTRYSRLRESHFLRGGGTHCILSEFRSTWATTTTTTTTTTSSSSSSSSSIDTCISDIWTTAETRSNSSSYEISPNIRLHSINGKSYATQTSRELRSVRPPNLSFDIALVWRLPCVTLTFDFLNLKVDHFRPLPHGQLVPIGIKIGLFISNYHIHKFGNRWTDERTDW